MDHSLSLWFPVVSAGLYKQKEKDYQDVKNTQVGSVAYQTQVKVDRNIRCSLL